MKALFVTYNQAYNEEIVEFLEQNGQRGFTRWNEVQGRGTTTGIPRLDSHAWPESNHAVFSMVEDGKVQDILAGLRRMDEAAPDLGLRAFVWAIESFY